MLEPLNKGQYFLYCQGEAWFNTRRYNNDLSVFRNVESIVQAGIEQMMKSARMNVEQETRHQQALQNDRFLGRLQNIVAILARPIGGLTGFIASPFTRMLNALHNEAVLRQQASQPLNPMQRLALKAADVFSVIAGIFRGPKATGIRDSDEDREQRLLEEASDPERYADLFVRRSQASSKSTIN
jgi:hypothetical protein